MSRDTRESREDIVRYLTGEPVQRNRLAEACAHLTANNLDPIQSLKQDSAAEPDQNPCAAFRESMAEFCDMSLKERVSEMPEFIAHLRKCEDCSGLYRDMKITGVWSDLRGSASQALDGAKTLVRNMADSIRIFVDRGSSMLWGDQDTNLLFGTPAVARVSAVMGTAVQLEDDISAEEEEGTAAQLGEGEARNAEELRRLAEEDAVLRKKWLVPDEETGFSFLFTSFVRPHSSMMVLQCRLVNADGMGIEPSAVGIEVLCADSGRLRASGCLADFEAHPLELPPGNWLLEFSHQQQQRTLHWKIRFDVLETEQGGDR